MFRITDYPLLVLIVSFVVLFIAMRLGGGVLAKRWKPEESAHEDFNLVLSATLTLLGLIVGFTFSMAVSRYDQRKNLEAEEANAIGTEYARAALLPAPDAARVRGLLKDYVNQRLLFYRSGDPGQDPQIDARTVALQNEMWSVVVASAGATMQPAVALTVSGMNDVLNSQGYSQAALWNRIPRAAWILMTSIAFLAHLLVGYRARNLEAERFLLLALPLAMSISFFLIADIDSPRRGVIRVDPRNLLSLSESLTSP
jgi:hypothetical protein